MPAQQDPTESSTFSATFDVTTGVEWCRPATLSCYYFYKRLVITLPQIGLSRVDRNRARVQVPLGTGGGQACPIRPQFPDDFLSSPDEFLRKNHKTHFFRQQRGTQAVSAALASVNDRPEMALLRQQCTDAGTQLQLPASYRSNPLTEEVERLVALHVNTGALPGTP